MGCPEPGRIKVQVRFTLLVMVIISTFTIISIPARAGAALNGGDLVEIAIESNPQVRSLRAQWEAAQHQILQNYAPADPTFTYGNVDSSKDFNAAVHSHVVSENFQFPGEAFLQADEAKRTAEIARLTYEAAVRDLRAGVETAYYQVQLDDGLLAVNEENIANLKQVVNVTQVQYTAGQAQQSDLIGAGPR
jgi:outer membrane protein TolC